MRKLADFEDRQLTLQCDDPIWHPNGETVIGRMAFDDKQRRAGVFPRTYEDHYFHKYEGYAVSTCVLDQLFALGVEVIYIAETRQEPATRRLIEYDAVSFRDADCVAYSEAHNTVVEGADAIEATDGSFNDVQSVVPAAKATRVWQNADAEVHV